MYPVFTLKHSVFFKTSFRLICDNIGTRKLLLNNANGLRMNVYIVRCYPRFGRDRKNQNFESLPAEKHFPKATAGDIGSYKSPATGHAEEIKPRTKQINENESHFAARYGMLEKHEADLEFYYGEETGLLQGKRPAIDNLIEVDTSAGEPVYTPSVQLLLDIQKMKPKEASFNLEYLIKFCLYGVVLIFWI